MERDNDQLQWIEFGLLSEYPSLIQRVFLRHGGVSINEFSSLNLGNNCSDLPEHVKTNREIIKKSLAISKVVYANQVHGTDIVEITNQNASHLHSCDGFVTKEKNIALAINHADCQAAIFYDHKKEIIAAIHSGWKGLVKGIYLKICDMLINQYKCNPNDIIVCISSSICSKHSEFKNYMEEFPKELYSFQVEPMHFDLKAIAKNHLLKSGITEENIEITNACTFCNEKDYFSYRRDRKTGRHATIIGMK
jgi:polyphenol oxidase